jgi:hypothetical protein
VTINCNENPPREIIHDDISNYAKIDIPSVRQDLHDNEDFFAFPEERQKP